MARRGTWRALALTLGLAAPLGTSRIMAAPPPMPPGVGSASTASGAGLESIQLKVRRLSDAIELIVEGAGAGPQLRQTTSSTGWSGQLTTRSPVNLQMGPQRLSIPEMGLLNVSLDGSGSTYRLSVIPMQGVPLGQPSVSADGRNLIVSFPASQQVRSTSARLDLTQPGRVPGQMVALPRQPRAVAPPLGDMAVGTMALRSLDQLNVSGPRISLVFKDVPVKDALMTIARLGGYGLVYVSERPEDRSSQLASSQPGASGLEDTLSMSRQFERAAAGGKEGFKLEYKDDPRPVTLSFVGETYSNAVNAILIAANVQARLQGRTIFAGPGVLSKGLGAQFSKIYRLNQASSRSAAEYLASLGARIFIPSTVSINASQGSSTNTGGGSASGGSTASSTTSSSQTLTEIQSFSSGQGPLLGLRGTIDSRLQTVTLVGDPRLVAVGEAYLKQIDLRQRQVALSVRILDVDLANTADRDVSFAFRSGNSFILSESGALSAVFGAVAPSGQPNPGLSYPNNQFVSSFNSVIVSSNTKTLASPTLILSENADPIQSASAENQVTLAAGNSDASQDQTISTSIGRQFGNEGFVIVGQQVVTSFTTEGSASGAPPVCTPVFSNAGLTFGARVSKIDDNGFVTFSLSPEISATVGSGQVVEGCGTIFTINRRRLDTGNLRVRDGQTLVLTGVISDSVVADVTKWPILGDIPFIGQFFRGSSTSRKKSELVIMVTPRIINDEEGGAYGYGYKPDNQNARQFVGG